MDERPTRERPTHEPKHADDGDGASPDGKPGGPRPRFSLLHIVMVVLAVMLLRDMWDQSAHVAVVPYSRFQELLDADQVEEVVVRGNEVSGQLKEPLDGKTRFRTTRVDPELAERLEEHGVEFTGQEESTFLPLLLSWVLPLALFLWFLSWMTKKRAGGGIGSGLLSVGKSRAKVYVETDTKTTFADVAGVEEAKAELQEIVTFLRDPASHGRLGARMPKGSLLVGPPGTGKTLLARAVAGEAGVPFFSISGSEFVEMFVGVGASRVRDLFEQARKRAPCIIFIDELDAIGRARGAYPGTGGHDEKEQTLNQLLVELDGFDPSTGIVLLAATNRPEILDPALLRAGRFDRQVLVDRPDKNGRAAILTVHMAGVVLAEDVDADAVAALTPGFTGADLANLVNEAALAATRRDAEAITMDDFNVAIERIIAGLEKRNRLLNKLEREIVAHHEMGHAFVAASLATTDRVHKVSIIPRGISALGYTIQRPTEDRYLMLRDEILDRMAVLLGGRAAEELVFGRISTGASDDLAKATDLARNMATRFGMVPELGRGVWDSEPRPGVDGIWQKREYSEETARGIDQAVKRLLDGAWRQALEVLRSNRALLEEAAVRLLEVETLGDEELEAYFARLAPARGTDGTPRPAPAAAPPADS